ncbi:MAG TPA: GNAT family protein [Candidatus Paceibacterota bacterium]|nr:GNAT family protein [Candidatus Paceibacterota bacterium]
MRHAISSEGFGVRLRPVRLDDARFIVWIRSLEHARGRVGDSAASIASQEQWLKEYFAREGDYYFVIETAQGRRPVGTYGLYDLREGSAESGRWIIRPEVPAAIPSAILALDLAFGTLNLKEVRATTVSTNRRVLSLNRKFGFRQVRVDPAAQVIGGQPVDLVRFVLAPGDWADARERLLPHAALAEQQVRDWDQSPAAAVTPTEY